MLARSMAACQRSSDTCVASAMWCGAPSANAGVWKKVFLTQ